MIISFNDDDEIMKLGKNISGLSIIYATLESLKHDITPPCFTREEIVTLIEENMLNVSSLITDEIIEKSEG